MYISELFTVVAYLHTTGFKNRGGINFAKCMFDYIFTEKIHLNFLKCMQKCRKLVVINDNNNFAPSLFRSLPVIGFSALVFLFVSCTPSKKRIPWPKTVTSDFT